MKDPGNPDLLQMHVRYQSALSAYKAAKSVFRLARKELKYSRISELRVKRKAAKRNLRKSTENREPHT